ncbi:MAG: carbonic anhydrase [Alphaproteobacteria bacterium]|nr:carbonic anhydrase [Alphaproteobacteria bacterium]
MVSRNRFTRRRVLIGGAAAAALAASPLEATASPRVAPAEVLARLRSGNDRYANNISANRDYSAGRAERSVGQAPFAALLGCADSRVAPELVFDQPPGQLFVVSVAGNFVNEDGLASLEYGAKVLGTSVIMVLGHSACGAVSAMIKNVTENAQLPGHLPSLIDAIRPAVMAAKAQHPPDLLAAATAENVRRNVSYLETAPPILANLVAKGDLMIVGGVYDIATGRVNIL